MAGVNDTKTILVVDDDPMIVDVLMRMLEMDGYHPISARSGRECLEALGKRHPDLILLDIMMDPEDGWQILQEIKANPSIRDIPVAMLTAKQLTPDEVSRYGTLIEDYIMKPTTHRQLNESIRYILSRHEGILEEVRKARDFGADSDIIDEYAVLARHVDVSKRLIDALAVFYDVTNAGKRGPVGQNIAQTIQQLSMITRIHEERLLHIRSLMHST
ncbi:MAG: two-component system response regulator [Methanoculleus sp. SDB]|nr:MAG: two-component system response regulator [Methanoculleus sp. SDB]